MARVLVLVIAALSVSSLAPALPEPVQEWSVSFDTPLGVSSIAFPSARPDSVVVAAGGFAARISGDGKVLFEASFGPELGQGGVYEPEAADLDGDGAEEIIAGHNGGYVFALNGNTGEVLWQFNVGSPLDTWEMSTPADLDGDGKTEVITCNNLRLDLLPQLRRHLAVALEGGGLPAFDARGGRHQR